MLDHAKLNALIRVFANKGAEHEAKARAALIKQQISRYLHHLTLARAINGQIEDFRLRIVLLNNSVKKVLTTAG